MTQPNLDPPQPDPQAPAQELGPEELDQIAGGAFTQKFTPTPNATAPSQRRYT